MAPDAILETAIYGDDLDAMEKFYSGIVGLDVMARMEGRHVFFRCGKGVLLVFDPAATRIPASNGQLPVPTHGAAGPGHICFSATADELAAWEDRLSSHGVEIESRVVWPNGGRSIYFRDPAGNSVEFAEPRIWGFENGTSSQA